MNPTFLAICSIDKEISEENPLLATIQFGSNFQDRLILPQIVAHFKENDLPIQTRFVEDPTIK